MISNARILLDVFLGFGVGYTAAGTFNHFFITPKPVSMMIGLLENKFVDGQTTIYVCEDKVCQLPVNSTPKAIKQIAH